MKALHLGRLLTIETLPSRLIRALIFGLVRKEKSEREQHLPYHTPSLLLQYQHWLRFDSSLLASVVEHSPYFLENNNDRSLFSHFCNRKINETEWRTSMVDIHSNLLLQETGVFSTKDLYAHM